MRSLVWVSPARYARERSDKPRPPRYYINLTRHVNSRIVDNFWASVI